jgi:hypothetical protein
MSTSLGVEQFSTFYLSAVFVIGHVTFPESGLTVGPCRHYAYPVSHYSRQDNP